MKHYVIEVFSTLWWQGLGLTILFIFLPLIIGRNLVPTLKVQFGKFIGLILLATVIGEHIYMVYYDQWTLDRSLPLQLCAIASILSGLVFFSKSQIMLEVLAIIGISGSLHSILTPEVSLGGSTYMIVSYYIIHIGLFLSPIYNIAILQRRLREGSWLYAFLVMQFIVGVVALVNYSIDANYMYLCGKPKANSPFIIGDWPYYIFVLEGIALVHFFIVYYAFKLTGNTKRVWRIDLSK